MMPGQGLLIEKAVKEKVVQEAKQEPDCEALCRPVLKSSEFIPHESRNHQRMS